MACPAKATIHYTVSLANPDQHLFHVTMIVPNAGAELTVAMPAWNATYGIRDFAFRVTDVRASEASAASSSASDSALHIEKLDKQTWRITRPGNSRQPLDTVQIQYDDFWNEPGPFSSQLNSHHAFLNLAEVLLYIPSRRNEDSTVNYTDLLAGWRVAEELPASKAGFVAPSYDALVDAPVEIGTFRDFYFDAGNAHVRVVVDGTNWNESQLRDTLSKIVSYETGMMHEVPFREYTFFFHFGPFAEAGGGGMEHSNCTAIATASGATAANVAAHEFFHLWNVKRIRPQTLQPVDYTKEMWTRALWFAEGVTSTYASYTMERTGLWDRQQFYADLAQQFTILESRPAHRTQSAEESSLDTWLDKYSYYDEPQTSISYYNKGQILGVTLDLAIRDATDNRKSLDDVLRAMNRDYAHRGRYYDDSAGVESETEKVAGRSFQEFFAKYVAGTAEIPYADFLRIAGLSVATEQREIADLGFETSRGVDGAMRVSEITVDSAAAKAGLRAGDVVMQLDGQPFPRSLMRFAFTHSPGEKVTVHIARDGHESDISFSLGARGLQFYSISEIPNAAERQKRIREGWLKGTTD